MTSTDSIEITVRTYTDDQIFGGHEWKPRLVVELHDSMSASIWVDERHSGDNGIPMDVWHGRVLRWDHELSQGSQIVVDNNALDALADAIRDHLEIVAQNWHVDFDGSNMTGKVRGDDANDAMMQIENEVDACEFGRDDLAVWHADEWLHADPQGAIADYKITADMTPEQRQQAADRMIADARADDIIITNVDYAIEWLQEQLPV
jgi:hypothetical protein